LSRLEVVASKKTALLLGIFDYCGVESVLRRPIEVEDAFLNSCDTVEDRGWERNVVGNSRKKVVKLLDFWK